MLNEALKVYIETNEISPRKLARFLGEPVASVQDWLAGKQIPIEKQAKIKAMLNIEKEPAQ